MVTDKIKVIITDNQKEVKIPTGIRMLMRRCCNSVLKMEKIEGFVEVSITMVNNEYIQELNKKYRNKDVPTDVLSFPTNEKGGEYDINPETGAKMLGDIVMSMEKVMEKSQKYGHPFRREVAYLTAHGVLHLLGYDHEKGGIDKMRMREKEDRVLDSLGFTNAVTYIHGEE